MRHVYLPACVAFALSLSGCIFSAVDRMENSDPPVGAEGTLTVEWTINGTTDSNQCVQAQAGSIEIFVTEDGTNVASGFVHSCDSFAATLGLSAGNYTANAALFDDDANVRTTWVDIAPFTIHYGEDLIVPIDFPSNSFVL